MATPRTVGAVPGRLTKPLDEVTIMAELQSTQTRPEFTWRFLTLGEFTNQIVNVTASTEREAREKTPEGCVCILACRFRVEEVQHV